MGKEIILPDPGEDFEYIKVPKKKDLKTLLKEERDLLKDKLKDLEKPSNAELISLGEGFHPFSVFEKRIKEIEEQLKELNK